MKETKKADLLFLALVVIHILVSFGISYTPLINMSMNQSLIFSQLLILLPVLFYLFITKTSPMKLIRFNKIDAGTFFMTILFVILIMPLISFLNSISMLFSENTVVNMADSMSSNPLALNLLLMAIVPSISEEFVFRGVFFHTYRKRNVIYGAILSGIIFGLMHLNFNQFSYAFAIGIIFALLIEATGSIYTTMLAHFIINGNSVVMLKVSEALTRITAGTASDIESYSEVMQSELTKQMLGPMILMLAVTATITTALAIGVYIWLAKHCKNINNIKAMFDFNSDREIDNTQSNAEKSGSPISIFTIISFAICIGFMIFVEVI